MRKVIFTKKLCVELQKWESMNGLSNTEVLRLLKLYIGMGFDFLITDEGKILASDFNKVALSMRYHSPIKLIQMAVESGSFYYEKCTEENMNNYGISWLASPVFASKKLVEYLTYTSNDYSPKNSPNCGHIMGVIKNNTIYSHSEGNPNGIKKRAGRAGKRGGADTAEDDGARFVPAVLEHPHGMYEYCYPGLPQRYYDFEGVARPIPDGAPDRPDDTVTWSSFTNKWDTEL